MAYAQQVMYLQFPISDDKREYFKKLREKHPVLDLSTFHYKEKPDTILMFDPILKKAWNEEGVQFKDSSAKITYCIYGNPSGKIQVFTINIDSEISDTDKQKILHASKKVFKKHNYHLPIIIFIIAFLQNYKVFYTANHLLYDLI